jgi:hypothetical protein
MQARKPETLFFHHAEFVLVIMQQGHSLFQARDEIYTKHEKKQKERNSDLCFLNVHFFITFIIQLEVGTEREQK